MTTADTLETAPDGSAPGRPAWVRRNAWWLRRLVVLPAHLLVFAVGVFFLVRAIPGDPILAMTGGNITPERYAQAQASLGLGGSLSSQLITYLGNLVTLDLGNSIITGRSVAGEFAARLPATVELAVMGMTATVLVSLAASYLIVFRPRNPASRVLALYGRTAGALPEFCLGVFLIFIFYAVLKWVPAPLGRTDPMLGSSPGVTGLPFLDALLSGRGDVVASMAYHLVLPIAVMVLAQSAFLIKLLVGGLTAAIDEPATVFRVASGAGRGTVLRSVFRRSLPATVAMCGTIFGYMLGAAVIIEQLFGLGGMGQYAVDAVNSADIVALQGFLIGIAVLSLLVFLLVDIVTMVLDPATPVRPERERLMTIINPLTAPAPALPGGRRTPRIADARVRMAMTLLPLAVIVLVAAFGPLLVPYDPERVAGAVSQAPSAEHLFGTDSSGMDVFTRTIVATRVNVAVAAAVAVLCTAVGVLFGLLIGMNESGGGPVGYAARLAARGVDLVQAVPSVLLGLVIVAFFGTTPSTLVLALAIVLTPLQLRLVRTEVLRVRGDAYVDAARQAGMSELQLTFRHVLPNSTWAAVENISVMFGIAILLTSALGFLGAGLPPPTPEWGYMIAEGGSDAAVGRWWAALMPTVAVILTVSAVAWSGARLWGPNRTGRNAAD